MGVGFGSKCVIVSWLLQVLDDYRTDPEASTRPDHQPFDSSSSTKHHLRWLAPSLSGIAAVYGTVVPGFDSQRGLFFFAFACWVSNKELYTFFLIIQCDPPVVNPSVYYISVSTRNQNGPTQVVREEDVSTNPANWSKKRKRRVSGWGGLFTPRGFEPLICLARVI